MESKKPFVLFDDAKATNASRLYVEPVQIISCIHPDDVVPTLAQIDQAVADGFHVAGYLAYELGYHWEPKLNNPHQKHSHQPLIWMGVFKAPKILNEAATKALMNDWGRSAFDLTNLEPTLDRDQYMANIKRIKEHICAGDVYQINYTFKQNFTYSGSPQSLYARLRQRQCAAYGAFLKTDDQSVLSLSPELFIETKGRTAFTRPMKGTASRAPSLQDDNKQRHWLCSDEKSKAENLMIVDLLRNDLGRISEIGSVKVTDLYSVETYPTLHQMTSGIQATLNDGLSFSALMAALFPCGSITGAPKVKAMELIADIEPGPRGVYTGAIGYASKKDGFHFNVAIRTLTLDNNNQGEMGIGSGIVYDSDAAEEWAECHLKADFVTQKAPPDFALLETLKWDQKDGFALLDLHLKRLETSAEYFCFPCDERRVISALHVAIKGKINPQRLRVTLDKNGIVIVETTHLIPLETKAKMTFCVSDSIVDRHVPWTYHKTTHRDFYDLAHANQGFDEVIFNNDLGELTEGSFTNLFLKKEGKLLTPPLKCGLLAGTLRQHLLNSSQAFEAVLTQHDLEQADEVYLGNSVRGLMKAKFMSLL